MYRLKQKDSGKQCSFCNGNRGSQQLYSSYYANNGKFICNICAVVIKTAMDNDAPTGELVA